MAGAAPRLDQTIHTQETEHQEQERSMDNVSTHEAVRLALLGAGFDPIPVNGKEPKLAGWQTLTDSTREDVIRWTSQRRHEINTGVVTKRTPAFDIDILEQAAADAVERLVRDRYSGCGVLLTRFGLAPKRAIPFRTDRAFKKITATLVARGGELHRLEFLGDGQQFVVDGIHPDTREPYSWIGGELGVVGRDNLPHIDEAEARRLVDDAVELLTVEYGYTLKEKAQPRGEDRAPPSKADPIAVGPRERAYAEAALCGRAADVAAMAPGSGRNDAALRAATRLGTMVAAGWVDARAVEDELAAAAEAKGKSKHDVRGTVRRGLGYGAQYPAPSLGEANAAAESAMAAANKAAMVGNFHPSADERGAERKDRGGEDRGGEDRGGEDSGAGTDAGARPLASRQLIKTSAEFVASLRPPDYLIKGVLQRRFLYSMTAPTGAGKTCIALRVAAHVAFGLPLSGRPVKQGRVLFLAGENPDDVCMRWIKLAEEMGVDVNTDRIIWLGARLPLSNKTTRRQIDAEVASLGEVALVVADTSAAFFEGDEENSNVQLGNHARMLRTFVDPPAGQRSWSRRTRSRIPTWKTWCRGAAGPSSTRSTATWSASRRAAAWSTCTGTSSSAGPTSSRSRSRSRPAKARS